MRRTFLKQIVLSVFRKPWIATCIVLLTTALGVYGISRLTVSTDIVSLLPTASDAGITYREALRDYSTFDYALVILEAREEGTEANLIESANRLASMLNNEALIVGIDYKQSDQEASFFTSLPDERMISLMTDRDWQTVQASLDSEAIRKRLTALRSRLQSSFLPTQIEALRVDPLGLFGEMQTRVSHSRGFTPLPYRNGYYFSKDGHYLLMVLTPLKPATDLFFSLKLERFLRTTGDRLLARQPGLSRKIDVHFLGRHIELAEQARQVTKKMARLFGIAFLLVLLLFIVSFRKVEALLFVGLPVIIGVIWTAGLSYAMFGKLSLLTAAFGVVLVGLGVDFTLQIYNRYVEEINRQRRFVSALKTAYTETGRGVLTSALTAAMTFYALYFTSFRGLRELGFVAGTGILCLLVSVLLVLPIIASFKARIARGRARGANVAVFALPWLARTVMGYPRTTLTLALLITAYLGYFSNGVWFDNSFPLRTDKPTPAQKRREKLSGAFTFPSGQLVAIISGSTLQGALERNDNLYNNLELLRARYNILSYDSLRRVLPSDKRQLEARSSFINLDLAKLEEQSVAIASKLRISPGFLAPFFEHTKVLQASLLQSDLIRYDANSDPYLIQTVPRYVQSREEGYRIATMIYFSEDSFDKSTLAEFMEKAQQGIGRVSFTGAPIVSAALGEQIKYDLALLLILGLLSILLALVLHFHSMQKALFALVPVTCTLLWLLGTLQLMGQPLNVLSLLVLPLIVGLGVNNGLQILQRFYEGSSETHWLAVEKTGRGVLISGLAVILSFMPLAFASLEGLRQIGFIVLIGTGYIIINSLTLLPSVLTIWGPGHRFIDLIGQDEGITREEPWER